MDRHFPKFDWGMPGSWQKRQFVKMTFRRHMIFAKKKMDTLLVSGGMSWNGICYLGQGLSAGTGKVIQHGQKEKRKKQIEEESIQQNYLRRQLAASKAPSQWQRVGY